MPIIVQENITQQSSKWSANVYKGIFESDVLEEKNSMKITQNVALQLHFDVQFIMQCMTSRENTETLTACQQALIYIERHIDPFDLSVFSPYMTTNVKRCVLKFQAMFGILIPVDRYALLTSMKATLPQAPTSSNIYISSGSIGTGGIGQPSENAIQLSNCTNRFPLLPIATKKTEVSRIGSRTTIRNFDSGVKGQNRDLSTKTKEQRTTEVASMATSFQGESTTRTSKREKSPVNKAWSAFEEMSNKWFGTGK